ncbi:Mus7/MMS22 family-domain-containing protein [Xylaria nigripes]|nr:Mus7/MMS22 family-domain-containing protein [Xylaria nigripes]
MAKWQELGEVPDSDDESAWDSQEYLSVAPRLAIDSATDSARDSSLVGDPVASERHDIWMVPFSSQASVQEHDVNNNPEPQEPEPSLPTPGSPITEPQSAVFQSSLVDLGFEIKTSTPDSGSNGQERSDCEEPVPALLTDAAEHSVIPVLEVHDVPIEQDADQIGDDRNRLGRLLRPRKPIQQHPYLLESAQYSKTWKSHGLRPVRVFAEQEKNRRQEEDSQEQEFEDDSQTTNKDATLDECEELLATRNSEPFSEIDGISFLNDGRLSPTPTPQPRPVRPEQALQSSQEEDEFPDPNDIEKWKLNKTARKVRKRRASLEIMKAKRPRFGHSVRATKNIPTLPDINNIFDIPASPPQTSPNVLSIVPSVVGDLLGAQPAATPTHRSGSDVSRQIHSPTPPRHHGEVIDLTTPADESDSENESNEAHVPTASERKNDQTRLLARRLRGVLPASWLRLDQQTSVQKPKPNTRHRSPDLSPERTVRKGVAQRRLVPAQEKSGIFVFDTDDSDDSDSSVHLQESNRPFLDINRSTFEDGAVSVIEEDHIDCMFSSGKRSSTGSNMLRGKRKRSQSMFNGQLYQRKRQQRITVLLGHNESVSNPQTGHQQASKGSKRADLPKRRNTERRKSANLQPPRLSILDVVEPNAPDFIRIAARTASRRRDQGRSSPLNKAIMLGTRQDTLDAVGVLRRWKEGMIQPRTRDSLPNYPLYRRDAPIPTAISHHNQASKIKLSTRFSKPRRMVKQTSMDYFVDVSEKSESERSLNTDNFTANKLRSKAGSYRPAQLEMPGDATNRSTFDARKRVLDAIYRRSRKSLSTFQNIHLEQSIRRQAPALYQQPTIQLSEVPHSKDASNLPRTKRRTALRKQVRPRFVDVSAPQHAHANDPLPRELSPPTVVLDVPKNEETGKLLGLAPYGTHYTQHFEVFPLDSGVFFHENTVIGNARLKKALDGNTLSSLNGLRGRCTFTIDEQFLNWGPWDSRVSSEFGIIFDWILDRLCSSSTNPELEAAIVVQAAEFVLTYLQDHLALIEAESPNPFAVRLVDVLQGFERRLKETFSDSQYVASSVIETITRVLVITMQALRLCQKLEKFSEAFQVEEVLKHLAITMARILLRTGLREVRDTYGNLQQMPFRERGIRNDQYSMIGWVVLIRILEEARLPRAGFWEVISSSILSPSADGTCDAAVLEQAWRTLFTLLPLGEFDNTGVVIPGIRHRAPIEGWALPQRLLQRVFNLYQSNSRQSAGFNDYLRVAVSRCHYLVEQWGWHKCNGILGAIFDFFAAQDLHNLRNEEVYQSPEFLEDLSGSPSLAISPEDRCFHIYLKLIAISIKRLRKFGMMKEVKNLVARLLPNHSRQYDKMMETHEAEIAALRNHHDLLCTLFWAAPPDMRPSSQSIEGLVVLRNSHKEACLISIRTWSRLSRFVVSTGEDISAYKLLGDWQRNIAQQVLDQVLSVETEIDQQLQGMSAEACKTITQEHKNAVINRNKKVAINILHFSMKAFLDVMRHTRTLGATSFVLNHYPLEQILNRLSFSSHKSDWCILQVILDIIDYYLVQINESTHAEPLQMRQSQYREDAIMLLERKYALHLISVIRGVINITSQNVGIGQMRERDHCAEHAVALAARLGACLIHAQLVRPRQFFQKGQYSLFQDISKQTTSPAQKYVPLFLATMIDQGVVDFKDLGLTPLDVFLAEIIKPFKYLTYENRLAMGFKRLGEAYLENAVISTGDTPDYNSNRDLFNYIIVSMRKALRQAGVAQKAHMQNLFSRALRTIMDRMKADLKAMVLNSAEHLSHIEFVRSIISLIRSQDLCSVDPFFYQISQEYSPSREDPRLQTAGILSWGLKLEEGDSKAMSGLFYLLFPSFKIALSNGELANEANILKESMQHAHVFSFVLGTMLPAIVSTATQVAEGWILLDTYLESIDAQLSSACIHQQIGNSMMDIPAIHTAVLMGIVKLNSRNSPGLHDEDIMSLTAMIRILNILSPSVTAFLINEPESSIASDITQIVDHITEFAGAADEYLSDFLQTCEGHILNFDHRRLFASLSNPLPDLQCNELVEKFSSHMIQDIRSNWVSSGATLTVKGPSRPAKPSATQSGQGTSLPRWEKRILLQNLRDELRTWNYAHNVTMRAAMNRSLLDEFFF